MERGPRFEGGYRKLERLIGAAALAGAGQEKSHVELKEGHQTIEKLLAQLVERSGDLSASAKASLRAQIQNQLELLGLKSLEDWVSLGVFLREIRRTVPTPDDYPTREEFEERVRELAQGRVSVVYDTEGAELTASSVATFGETNWGGVQPRTGTLVDYLYDLGKVMCSEFHYRAIFESIDAIKVTPRWEIDNGRHRSFALRVLGENYVREKGLDEWVAVRRAE